MKKLFLGLAGLLLLSVSSPTCLGGGGEIRSLIDDALEKGEGKIALPPGKHRVAPAKPGDDYHLYVRNRADLEIRGENTILVFENPKAGGILFENCRRVALSGITIDWDPSPSPQGRIISVNPEGPWIEIQADKGYLDDPAMFTKEGMALIYDAKTRLLKRGAWEMSGAKLSHEREGVLKISFKNSNLVSSSGAAVGDLLALRGKGGKMGVRLVNCSEMLFEKVVLWSAPGIGLQEIGGEGRNKYVNYTVTRGPAPGGVAERLLSSAADAFHSSGVRHGPTVENCLFEYQGDDGIAIHGAYMLVVAGGELDRILISPKYEMPYQPGDRLRIYDGKTYQLKNETKVLAVSPADKPKELEPARQLWKQYRGDADSAKYFNLTAAGPVKVNAGDLVSSPDWTGSGYAVRKNVIRHNRAQGLRIKADDGVIEDNQIEGVMAAGIALGPEFAYWLEGDYVRNTVIRNNTIRDVGLGAECIRHDRAVLVGAITVYALTQDRTLPIGNGNSNLVIEGNVIDNCGGIGMLILCAKDSIVKNNTIGNTRIMKIMEGGKAIGVDPDASIYADECANVRFENNSTSGKGVVLGGKVKN